MNKVFLCINAITLSMSVQAQNGQYGDGTPVDLSVGYFDPTHDQNPPVKGPVQVPYVTLDDHTLYIWSQHSGFTLTMYDDNDNVVYQTYVYAGMQMVSVPTTLSGSFTLILSDDTYMYTGTIDL